MNSDMTNKQHEHETDGSEKRLLPHISPPGMRPIVQRQFGDNAEKYVSSEEHSHGEDLQLAVKWLRPTSEDSALDVATGGGHMAKAIARHVKSLIVSDGTPDMLEAARHHLQDAGVQNAHYLVANAEALPLLDESFDIVTCRIAAHHFLRPDRFVAEVARVLRPNGRFLLVDNVVPDDEILADFMNLVETVRDPSHVQCLSIERWKSLFAANELKLAADRLAKKIHPFSSWLERMAPSNAHRFATTAMLLEAPEEVKTHFEIIVQNGGIQTFATDQWVALSVKE